MADRAFQAPPDRGKRQVLLVDNDPDEARRSELALTTPADVAIAVRHAPTLAEALRVLATSSVDAVVLELALADATGLVALAAIRGAAPDVPVVVYTRDMTNALALRAISAGAHDCRGKIDTPPAALPQVLALARVRQQRITALTTEKVSAAHRATHDPLTGVANRALFLDQLERALAFAARYHRKTGLLFLDLDGFKQINDRYGHASGDMLLRTVARRVQRAVRRSDIVARFGGDEFVVLLPEVTSRRDVTLVRDMILEALHEPLPGTYPSPSGVAASIGSAMSPLDGVTADALLAAADANMYQVKQGARPKRRPAPPTTAEAGPSSTAAAPPSLPLPKESRLRRAMESGALRSFYQPVLDVRTGRVMGAEVLLRWQHPTLGLLPASDFLDLAEDTGLIVPIGERVLREACLAWVSWRALGVAEALQVRVNVSAVQLREHDFVNRTAAMLVATGCPAEALIFELTETSAVVAGTLIFEPLRALRDLGVRLVVDDFGVSHGSMSLLREAPLDGIKIDRRFVAQLLLDRRDRAIVASLVRLGRGLGLGMVATGVEQAGQSEFLARLQCFGQQGRHFCDAVALESMTGMLLERNPVIPRAGVGGLAHPAIGRPA